LGRDFRNPSGARPASYTMSTGCFPGVERPRRALTTCPI